MTKRRFRLIFPLLLLFAAVFSAPGAGVDPELLERAAAVTAERYPDADSVLLDDIQNVVYQEDGRAVETDDFYQKILTDAGRRSCRELTFYYNVSYEKFTPPTVEVIRPDGTVLPVDVAANGREAVEPSQMGANIYDPANKIFTVTVSELEIGDILHVVSRDEIVKPRVPDSWSSIFVLQSDVPILRYEVRINAPEDLPLKAIALKDPVPGTVRFSESSDRQDGRIVYRWIATDVPRVTMEPDMPPAWSCVQRLLVSTAKDWPEISRWYYELCRPRLDAVTPEIRAKTAELIRNAGSDEEKIMALFQFVSQQIRYMGLTAETEAPGYEPHDVSLTFNQRYGVCRDKAALLVTMLELAGFDAYPVLFMSGFPKDDEVPNPFFNHAVVAVETAPETYLLMDPTVETTTELFPSALGNMSYLVAKPRGDKLRRSPTIPAEANMMKISTRAAVAPDGTLSGESRFEFSGINDMIYRDAFSRWPVDYRRQFFASRLRAAIPGAELESLEILPENVRDMSVPLTARLRFGATEFLPEDPAEFLLQLPEFGSGFGAVGMVLRSTGLKSRKFPLEIFSTCGVAEEFTLELPSSCRIVSLPEAVSLQEENVAEFRRSFTVNGSTLSGRNYFAVETVEIRPPEYLKIKEMLKSIAAADRTLPVARLDFAAAGNSAFPTADSLLLERRVEIELESASAWKRTDRETRKILTYAGVKNDSEVKIEYNPIWEEVSIEAVVANSAGKNPLSASEVNRMDAPWNASAPRYPGGKFLIANLPGVMPNAIIESTVRREYRERPFFSLYYTFAGESPVVRQTLQVTVPRDLELKFSPAPPGVSYSERETTDGKIVHEWMLSSTPQLPAEPGSAPDWTYAPTVFLSTGDYAEFGAKYDAALRSMLKNQPRAAALAAKLAPEINPAAPPDPALNERYILAIRDWVAKRIRPAGPSANLLPWSQLTAADRTLESGYGDSADRAILLGAMLDAAGIEFRFVAAAPLGYAPATVRDLGKYPVNLFTEILLYLPGNDCYLNDTGEYAQLGAVNADGMIGLDLATGELRAIRAQGKIERGVSSSYAIRISGTGAAEVTLERTFTGNAYEAARRQFAEMLPEERRQYFESLTASIGHSAELSGTPEYDFNNYPGRLTAHFSVPDFAVKSGAFLQFELPGFGEYGSLIHTADAARRTPFWRNRPDRLSMEYRIELPAGYRVVDARPERIELGRFGSAGYYEYREMSGDTLLIDSGLSLPVEWIRPLDYVELISLQRELTRLAARRVILRSEAADSHHQEKDQP